MDKKEFSASEVATLVEGLRSDFRVVAEVVTSHNDKLDAVMEMVAQNTEDIAIMKTDLSFIKQNLKRKVDIDEFEVLEKRVLFLENKLKIR
jgi:hypothetical protein